MIKYTTIIHKKRQELGISMLEYVLLDTVDKLSRPTFRAHKKTIADFVGMSRGGLIKAINRLSEKGLLIRVNDKEIAVTQKWIDETVIEECKQSEQQVSTKLTAGVNKVDSQQRERIKEKELNKQKEIALPDFIDAELWNDFMILRKSLKAKNTDRAVKMLLKDLEGFEKDFHGDANLSIENSIKNSWKGVFKPKKDYDKNTFPQPWLTKMTLLQGGTVYADSKTSKVYDSNGLEQHHMIFIDGSIEPR